MPQSTTPAAPEELFERNLTALDTHAPGLVRVLRGIQTPQAQIRGSHEGADLNLDLGHAALYEPDAGHFAEAQLANYRLRPTRMYINLPKCPAEPQFVPDFVLRPVLDRFADRHLQAFPSDRHEHAGFMIVYGIGLGLHLTELVEDYDFRHLVLIEQFPEFIYHSLHIVDWAAWLDRLEARGGTVRFLIGADPAQMAQRLYWDMRHCQLGLIDGAYIYRHYNSYLLDKTEQLFRETLPVLGVGAGFFEDEEKMLRNTFANLVDYDFSLLEPRRRLEQGVPALIVGSGPSIDASIDEIRRLREQSVLFSCGTALGVLLRNGIKPDFHCEVENVPQVFEHLSSYRSWSDFDGITLITSTTVDPRVPGLFPQRIFYFRDTVSPTGFFGKGYEPIYGAAPTVTNLGLRAALILSFREIYLFGVDLGTRERERHHSKDSFYQTNDTWRRTYARAIEPMNHELPGNFGGVAYTNRVLLWARLMMGGILEQYSDRTVYNCSDGVQIPKTLPRLPARVQLAGDGAARRRALARVAQDVDRKQAGELVDGDAIVRLRSEFAEFYRQLLSVVATARSEEWEFLPFHDAVDALLTDETGREYPASVHNVSNGSLLTILQSGYFLARRLSEPDRPLFMSVYLDAITGVVERMAREVEAWLDDFLSRLDARMAA